MLDILQQAASGYLSSWSSSNLGVPLINPHDQGRLVKTGCSPPWKMYRKRFRQTAEVALSLDLVTNISKHNHFPYFRHHFGSTFPRNPTKPMFRCFPTTRLMRWRFQHTCRWIWRFRGCLRHSSKGKIPNNWLQETWWCIRLSQSVFVILTMNF